jgi:transcriptional regulator with XRE-family HTH domain
MALTVQSLLLTAKTKGLVPMNEMLSFGEYVRRRRREKRVNLMALAQATGVSYSHLSRIESDSTLPNAATVAKLAEALDGDLKLMLQLANCLPRTILDRIEAMPLGGNALRRAAYQSEEEVPPIPPTPVAQYGLAHGLNHEEAAELHEAIRILCELQPEKRRSLIGFIKSLSPDGGDEQN